ncbi:site-specific integrase [Brevibacillus reuszeri]|uniref:site-specific integrase n=1 Tax=Brevibacillus reuszeri TaxID=54915 RepID=UPI00289CCDFD|nr:site-specific integrase [Brevibacillus reuszeri]
MRIDQIKPLQIATFLKELEKPGARKDGRGEYLDIGTIQYVYRVLKNVFNAACEFKLLPENPMSGIKKPTEDNQSRKKKLMETRLNPQYFNEEEAQAVVDALYKESRKWRLLILGSMIGGCRRGELVGLEWQYVSFEDDSISIENNIPLTEAGQAIEKDPKSLSSIRTIDMPSWYMEELEKYYTEWQREKELLGDKWQGEERQFVFHNGVGKPYYYQHPSRWWKRFCERHNLRYIKFHGLRHSSGTLLIEDEKGTNVDSLLKAIQERLGHSRLSTTADIYIHVTKKVKKRTAGKFDKFSRKEKTEELPEEKPVLKRVK